MELLPEISFRNLDASPALEERIRGRLKELEQFHPRITSCRVVVEKGHRRHHQGNVFGIRLVLRVPGKEIVISRDPQADHAHEDAHVAVRDAFDAARRQLEDYVRSQRGTVKLHEVPDLGRVSKLIAEEDYGFLESQDGTEIYFHRNSVVGNGFDHLKIGDQIRFVLHPGEGEKGPQASSVVRLGKHHPSPTHPG